MNNNIIKPINNILLRYTFSSNEERIITGIVVYKQILKMIQYDDSVLSKITSVAENLIGTHANIVSGMRNVYISYNIMCEKIKNSKISSLLDLNDSFLNEIYLLYLNKTEIKPFSCSKYSPYIYSLDNLSMEQDNRLREIHYNVLVPIVKYYINNNGISETDVNIYSALVFYDSPGKGILFDINNISSTNIINDVWKTSIGIRDNIYKAQFYDNKVLIIIK